MSNEKLFKPVAVDLDEVIKKSESKFIRSLPKFVVNMLKKIICQAEINEAHSHHYLKGGIDYVNGLIDEFDVKVKTLGTENIAKDGRYVYVANHPLGALDGIAFLQTIHRLHGNVISPTNEVFDHLPNLNELMVGINVFGKNTREKLKIVNDVFASDRQVMYFPSGEVSRKTKGKIRDPEWHKTFVTKAVQFKRDVVPCFISGQNSEKFYRIANIRKFSGIKTYIETILLPCEMIKNRGCEIVFNFKKPIPFSSFDKSASHFQWAQRVRDIVYEE